MRTNMETIIWCTFIFILLLLISPFCNIYGWSYISNICMGIISSLILTSIISLVLYKIIKRENLISYLGALQLYRCKFKYYKRNLELNSSAEIIEDCVQSLKELFYDVHYNYYLKLYHFNKNKALAKDLNRAFELICKADKELCINNSFDIDSMERYIDEAITIVENQAKKLKCIQIKEKNYGKVKDADGE